jgi:hypothetical protein
VIVEKININVLLLKNKKESFLSLCEQIGTYPSSIIPRKGEVLHVDNNHPYYRVVEIVHPAKFGLSSVNIYVLAVGDADRKKV